MWFLCGCVRSSSMRVPIYVWACFQISIFTFIFTFTVCHLRISVREASTYTLLLQCGPIEHSDLPQRMYKRLRGYFHDFKTYIAGIIFAKYKILSSFMTINNNIQQYGNCMIDSLKLTRRKPDHQDQSLMNFYELPDAIWMGIRRPSTIRFVNPRRTIGKSNRVLTTFCTSAISFCEVSAQLSFPRSLDSQS